MRNSQPVILNAADTQTQTGSAIWVGQIVVASFIPVFGDSTATGTVKIQASNEAPVGPPVQYTPSNGSFADIPNATSTIASGVGPAIVIPAMCFAYVRAVFTYSSGGSSTVKVEMNQSGV